LMFVVLAGLGGALLIVAFRALPETLPAERRATGGVDRMVTALRAVATDRRFVANAMAGAFATATLFVYIGGASFVLQGVYDLSPQLFGIVFGVNAFGVIAGSQANALLVRRFGVARMLNVGLLLLMVMSLGFLIIVLTSLDGVGWLIICMFGMLAALGIVSPNSMTLAMEDFPHAAGSASAALGLMRFAFGAVTAPLVGLTGADSALSMASWMTVCATAAFVVRQLLRPRGASAADEGRKRDLVPEAAVDPPL